MRDKERKPNSLSPETIVATVNRTMLLTSVLIIAAVVSYASFYPLPLVLPTISSLLTTCALAAATVAFLRGQNPANRHFTLWDLATVWLFLAFGAWILSDPAAAKAYLQATSEHVTSDPAAAKFEAAAPPPIE